MLPTYLTGDRLVLESVSRGAAHAVRLNDNVVLCRVLGRYLMAADADDYTVAPHVALDGYWEPWTTLAIARAVRPGAFAVDVGANHGYFTLLVALAAGQEGRVLGVEPNPRLAALAARTLEMNGVGAIAEVRNCAAGSGRRSDARLVVPLHHGADGSLHRPVGADDLVFEVESLSIDELTAAWPAVDFVKIDAEGSEQAIWQGMGRTLSANAGITLVMEFKPEAYSNPGGFLESIASCGFVLRSIEEDGNLKAISVEGLLDVSSRERMLFLRRE